MQFGIHWFRRDLRVDDNPALQWNWKRHSGKVVGIFCFDKAFLSRPDFSSDRFQLFLESLRKVRDELRARGGDLLALDVGPLYAFPKLFEALRQKGQALPATFSWNRDYEPFARERDGQIERLLRDSGIESHTERDHLLIEPHEIVKTENPSSPYQIFTPFKRQWLQLFETPAIRARWESQLKPSALDFSLTWKEILPVSDVLEQYAIRNEAKLSVPLPPAGGLAALQRVRAFLPKVKEYAVARDIPAREGTSGISVYLKNGSLTVAQVIATLNLKGADNKFLTELVWREFYYYILHHFPHVEKEAFQTRYNQLRWENRDDYFEAWKAGRTGFPLVDAGMRQLQQTGWMHNRVRMVVASFLTKDLLIDYRWGERYFMEKLLDGDLAPNNGGWQWAASTGCDAQPYFRIFNPTLQSKKFDPDGAYIRKYVPELAGLDSDEIHEPKNPIVDHAAQREKALALFKSA